MSSETSTDQQFQPWQFFTLAGLTAAAAVVFLQVFKWDADRAGAILMSIIAGMAAFAGFAAYRTLLPLSRREESSGPEMLAGRTRAAIEREKTLALRSIKDLEFDRAMGKLSDKDFADMDARLRARAAGLLRQLDRGSTYRDEIEKELEKRIGAAPATKATSLVCAGCGVTNDVDAKFCKSCGTKLETVQ